jgi:hypothetical protein
MRYRHDHRVEQVTGRVSLNSSAAENGVPAMGILLNNEGINPMIVWVSDEQTTIQHHVPVPGRLLPCLSRQRYFPRAARVGLGVTIKLALLRMKCGRSTWPSLHRFSLSKALDCRRIAELLLWWDFVVLRMIRLGPEKKSTIL